MTTFSQLVDKILLETRRPDLLTEIVTYLNQTVRELHFRPDTGAAMIFRDNLVETQLTATSEESYVWTIPEPQNFQAVLAFRYDDVWVDNEQLYPPEKTPGRGLYGLSEYYYRAGYDFAFKGYGGLNATISAAYYQYPKALKYKASTARPATYDDESGWTYYEVDSVDYDEDDDSRALAQSLVTNWIIFRWPTLVEEGLRAKVYKRIDDTNRARTSYSLYSSLRQGFITSESADLAGYQ